MVPRARRPISSGDLFYQATTVACQTRVISTDMRARNKALRDEGERIVTLLRGKKHQRLKLPE